MEKKASTVPVAPKHTTIEQVRKNIVKMSADTGWQLRSKHTGKTSQSVITAHVEGYEVIEVAN